MKIKPNPKKKWKDQDHLFEPSSITKLEFISAFEVPRYKKVITKPYFPRAMRPGKVTFLVKNGITL